MGAPKDEFSRSATGTPSTACESWRTSTPSPPDPFWLIEAWATPYRLLRRSPRPVHVPVQLPATLAGWTSDGMLRPHHPSPLAFSISSGVISGAPATALVTEKPRWLSVA